MKNYIFRTILLLTLVNSTYGESCFDKLRIHIADAKVSPEFKNFIKNDPDGLYVLQKLTYSSEAIRTDVGVLKFYKNLVSNNIEGLGTTLISKLNDAEIVEFASTYKNFSKIDLEKFVANEEFIDVWKKWKDRNVTSLEDIALYQKVCSLNIRNISFDDFYFKTRHQIKKASNPTKFAPEVFEAWKKGVGHEADIQSVFVKYGLEPKIDYPPCDGIWGIIKKDPPKAGDFFDRFQTNINIDGSYGSVCPSDFSYTLPSRALKENYINIIENSGDYFYFKFKFKSTYTSSLEYREAIPWFGKQGESIQVKLPNKLDDISKQIEIVEKWKLEKGKWVQVLGNAGSDLFSSFTHLKNLPTDAKTFLTAKNWDNVILTKLDGDLANTTLKSAIDAKPQLIDAWEIVSTGSESVRRNTANLEKLNDFISATGMEKPKLISSFGNAKSPQKWVGMKIPESNLDALHDGFKNLPPSKFDAWTPDHKAQRWANHKKGNPDADFNTWSNKYDGNIDKANFANNGVNDYFSTLTGNVVKEKSYTNISINTPDGVQSFTRRLDIVDEDAFKGIEFKEYSSGKVYRSPDIKREYVLDGKLLQDDLLDDIEWIFKGCEPSAPLRTDLEALGITVTLLP